MSILSITMSVVITLLFFKGVIKLHHFGAIRLYDNNDYSHKYIIVSITLYLSSIYIVI